MLPASIATAKMFTARMRVVSDHRPDHFNERSSLFFGESVADAIERFDCLEALVDGAELLRSEEHTSELQSLMRISYAVFCLKKTKHRTLKHIINLATSHVSIF